MLRVQLINDIVGSIVIEEDDPIDINGLTQTLKRADKDDGVVFEVILDLEFIKKGRKFIKDCFEIAGGVDADVTVNIYERDFNNRKWDLYATGKINYNKYDLGEDRVTINIEQAGVQRRIQNRMDIDVDLETITTENGSALPSQATIDVEYHSKTILKKLDAKPGTGVEFSQGDVMRFSFDNGDGNEFRFGIMVGQLSTEDTTIDELEDSFKVPFGWLVLTTGIDRWLSIGATLEAYDTDSIVYYNGSIWRSLVDNNPATPGTDVTKWVEDYSAILKRYTDRSPIYNVKEEGVCDIDIKMRLKHKVFSRNDGGDVDISGSGHLGTVLIKAWFEHRAIDNTVKTITQIGSDWVTPGSGGSSRISDFETKQYTVTDVDLEIGDLLYVYYTMHVTGTYDAPELIGRNGYVWHEPRVEADLDNTYVKITSKTTAPVTNAKSILLHEAFQRIAQFHTNQLDCFRSDLLGRPEIVIDGDTPYTADGDAALIVLTNGGNLRSLENKKIFASMRDILEFVNMLQCAGVGFESIDGKSVMRLEKKEYFYDKTTKVLSLGRVYNIKKRLNPKLYYNQIEVGYNGKIDIGQTNAIDEINTVRRFGIPVINTKNQLKVSTKMRSGGYQIEAQRRLTFSTSDGKLDDENFAVSVIRDGENFVTKKDEGYTGFYNVFDPASSYNLDLSPARALKNWLKIVASSLIRSTSKLLKFTYGEVNYTAGTKKGTETTFTYEDGTVDLTGVQPIWDNFIYEFDAPLTRDEFKLLKANPYGYIEFEDQFGEVMEGFISDEGIEHDSNKGMANFKLLKVFRPTV